MTRAKKSISFLIPSIADIMFLSLFLYLSFSAGKGLLNDGDTGYHIRAGECIIDTLSIPRYDMFSFLSPALPWTAHEWLSEVIMAMVHRAFGLTGVVIFFSFMIALIYYLLFKIIRTDKGDIILAAFIVLLVIASSQIHWLARPHIFSLVLMIAWYYLLDAYQYKNRNYLYLLPPIMLLWVNLHGGFLAGFILTGIYLFGNLVKFVTSQGKEKDFYKKKAGLLGLTTVACLLVSLINPYGFHILLFPFNLVSNKFIMDNVTEFMSPNFHLLMPFKYLLFLMVAVFAVSKVKTNFIELLLILMFTNMSLYSGRYIPLFAIIVAPILSRQLKLIMAQANGKFAGFLKKRSDSISETDASARGFLWPVAAVVLVALFAAGSKIDFKFDEKTMPVAAVEFMKKENLKGNMFDNDEFGDYIIYSVWPEYRVFFDGRSDMYGADRFKEYLKVARVKPGWDEVIEKYKINWIIYNANSTLSVFLMEREDWKLIYADKVANIFVKNTPENQPLIQKYPDVKPVVDEEGNGKNI